MLAGGPALSFAQRTSDYGVHSDYAVVQWTVLNGLPNNTVTDLLVASDGYLWLTTNDGLVRFDGSNFTVFNVTNTPQLPSNRFVSLVEEPTGYLWIESEQGDLALYHDGQFTGFKDKIPRNLWKSHVPVSANAAADTVLLGTEAGLARYVEDHLEPYRRDVIAGPVQTMARDADGRLWIYTLGSGLHRFEPDGSVRQIHLPIRPEDSRYIRVVPDASGRMWVQLDGVIFRIDGDQVETVHTGEFNAFTLESDGAGGIWISSREEGWWHHEASGRSTLYPKSTDDQWAENILVDPEGQRWEVENRYQYTWQQNQGHRFLSVGKKNVFTLQNDRFEKMRFDQHGNLWIATRFHGLFRIRRSFLRTLSVEEGLPDKEVYPILEDRNGSIWIGTFGQGLARFDTAMQATVFEPWEQLNAAHILSLHEDHRGNIWVGHISGMCRMVERGCEDVVLPSADYALNIRAMFEDQQNRFWVGTEGGLFVGQPEDAAFTWSRISQHWVRVIIEARDGTLFFGTNGDGLLSYDKETGDVQPVAAAQGLPSTRIRDLYEDTDGYLWIALEDRGLCRLDQRDQAAAPEPLLACIDSHAGLYQSGLHRIIEDDDGRFWFNTNSGIFWVERAMLNAYFAGEIPSVTSVSYTEADGMRHREGNGGMQPAGIKARDGRLWFPTQDGVVIIDPTEVPPTNAPVVVLETVQVSDQMRHVTPSLTLQATERDVAFRYAALEFNRPEDVRFQYWLEGYDATWRDGGTERVAAYTNLSPGDYTFQVRAGVGGTWGNIASMTVVSTPFFWEAIWFRLLMGLLVLVIGAGLYASRVRQLKAREAELEHAVAERTEQLAEKAAELEQANARKSHFLANLSHEFRTPLTLTFGPLDDLLNGRFKVEAAARPHLERARRNGGRLLLLINQLLDLSRLDAGALRLQTRRHDLAQHLRQMAALFGSFAQTHTIDFTTNLPDHAFHVYDADKIEKVIVNLLSNAFKFTPAGGKVSLLLTAEADGAMRVVVADTGPGIPEAHLKHLFDRFYQVESASTRSHEGTGIGLALVKELVDLHDGTIEVESTVGFGTRFTVRLPRLAAPPLPETSAVPAAASTAQTGASYAIVAAVPTTAPLPETPETAPDEATVVLVVDDNADMRAYIRSHLEQHFTIVEAENGRAGMERAIDVVPDLILSDVMMPEMDGLEACAALKADVRTSHIPVVLLTAKAEVDHRIEGFEHGADAYLPKPFNAEELQVRVRTMIAERQRLRARFVAMAGDGEPTAASATQALPPHEAAFLAEVEAIIKTHLSDAPFSVELLAEALLMSRRQLFRKLRALTEETPAAMIRRLRLEHAAVLLRDGELSVKEVAVAVGFSSQASFGRLFRETYGVPPSRYGEAASS